MGQTRFSHYGLYAIGIDMILLFKLFIYKFVHTVGLDEKLMLKCYVYLVVRDFKRTNYFGNNGIRRGNSKIIIVFLHIFLCILLDTVRFVFKEETLQDVKDTPSS